MLRRWEKNGQKVVLIVGLFLALNFGCSAKDEDSVQLIVKFKESSNEAQRESVHKQIGAQKVRSLYGDPSTDVVKVRSKALASALKAYQQSSIVKYAEKDLKLGIPPNEK